MITGITRPHDNIFWVLSKAQYPNVGDFYVYDLGGDGNLAVSNPGICGRPSHAAIGIDTQRLKVVGNR